MLKDKDYLEMLKESTLNSDPYADDMPDEKDKIKGFMLDPILDYTGEGELETNRELKNIIEQFYFDEAENNDENDEEIPEEEEEVETPEGEETPEEEEEEENEEGMEESFNVYNDKVLQKLISEMENVMKGPLNKSQAEEEEEESIKEEEEVETPEEEEEKEEEKEEETLKEQEEEEVPTSDENIQEMIEFFNKELA